MTHSDTANWVKVTIMFAPQMCPTCSVLFMVAEPDLETRRSNGRTLFCPSGHAIVLSAEGELADLRRKLQKAERERSELAAVVLELNGQLMAEKISSLEFEGLTVEEGVAAEVLLTSEPVTTGDWRSEVDPKACEECVGPFMPGPNVNKGIWDKQKYCSVKCRTDRNTRIAKERAEQSASEQVGGDTTEAPKTVPVAEPVQDAKKELGGLEESTQSKISPPELPTLTDPGYGGPPAPEEVAEEFEPEPEQVADHVEQVAEQVEASSVDEPHSSVDSEATGLEPSMLVEKPSMPEPDKSEPDKLEQSLQTGESKAGEPDEEAWQPGELKAGELIAGVIEEVRKDPRIGRAVRPVKLPRAEPIQRPPVPPPSAQPRLPDPRPPAPLTILEGEVLERADNGTCPNEGCGRRLNGFGKCRHCEQREKWLEGQRVARINEAGKSG